MIKLEGFEIEEMRSMNHILTVELQFLTPVTQKEASEYLKNLLENANDNVINEENLETKKKQIANAFGVPETVLNDETFDAAVKAEFEKAKKPEKSKAKPEKKKQAADVKAEDSEPKPKRTKIDWDKACALKKAGWSNDNIAQEINAPIGTINAMIYQRLKEYNEGKRYGRREEVEE